MPLIETTLQKALETKIKALESKLTKALDSKSDGIYKIHENLDKIFSSNTPTGNYDADAYKKKVWETISKEWSEGLSKQFLSILAPELSKIMANEITKYIKTATIITPLGQGVQTVPTTGTGTTITPSGPATIS